MDELSNFDLKLIDGLEFCAKVYALLEDIRKRPNGIPSLRLKSGKLEKKLLEELIPLCTYIQSKYRAGRYICVRWVDGSQQYDASIIQHGFYVEHGYYSEKAYLEVTCAMHPKEYLGREHLEKEGHSYGYNGLKRKKDGSIESVPVSYRRLSFIDEDSERIQTLIKNKCAKKYPENTTLIVQVSLATVYGANEWTKLIEKVSNCLPKNQFEVSRGQPT